MLNQIGDPSRGKKVFTVRPDSFESVPNAPFDYWVSDSVRNLFLNMPQFESEERTARVGLQTSDDFRFLRLWWEVPQAEMRNRWFPFAKGGEFSPIYADLHLVVNWSDGGKEIAYFKKAYIRNPGYYFRPGLTWPRRTNGLSIRCLPSGSIFGDKGPSVFLKNDTTLNLSSLAVIMNSPVF